MADRLTAGVLSSLALIVVAAGCGGSPILDAESLEQSIETDLLPDAPGAVGDVDCPEVILDTTETVTCTASIRDRRITVLAEVSDAAVTRLSTDAPLIDIENMATAAADRLTVDLGVETSVACPGPSVVVAGTGTALRCDAIDENGGSHPVIITLVDDEGGWELTLDTGAPG